MLRSICSTPSARRHSAPGSDLHRWRNPTLSPMKAMGVGELGICGAAAAVANAVYNATGVRVRDYPVTIDKLLPQLGMSSV
jgi:CO/xanthine dehydrogenase Mo-binding subunit